jgi:insertion element IS1 protein InsB
MCLYCKGVSNRHGKHYVQKKRNQKWIVYAIRKDTTEVVDFAVGARTNATLKRVTDTLVLSNANHVYTDKLPVRYSSATEYPYHKAIRQ